MAQPPGTPPELGTSSVSIVVSLLLPINLASVPNRLTMYRPICPVAPNTVAVCPVGELELRVSETRDGMEVLRTAEG